MLILFNSVSLRKSHTLLTVQQATLLLGRQGVLDTPVAVQPVAVTQDETLNSVMADTAGTAVLAGMRARVIDNVNTHLNATLPGGTL